MSRIVIAGEVNPDLILQGYARFPQPGRETLLDTSRLTLGGSGAICAAGLVRLGETVLFAGKCGDDVLGRFSLEQIERLGVDVRYLHRDPKLSTGVTVAISDAKDRALVTVLGAVAEFRAADIPDEAFAGCSHLHVAAVYLQRALQPELAALLRRAKSAGLTTSIDPGFDPFEQWRGVWEEALPLTDVFLPNESELAALTGECDPAAGLWKLSERCPLVVAKLGADGAMAMDGKDLYAARPFPVTPVDTTGAGDSFDAGFLHSWLADRNVPAALRFGCATGAMSTLGMGGAESQPTREQARAFMDAEPRAAMGA